MVAISMQSLIRFAFIPFGAYVVIASKTLAKRRSPAAIAIGTAPLSVDGWRATPYGVVVHYVVVDEREVVEHLEGGGEGDRILEGSPPTASHDFIVRKGRSLLPPAMTRCLEAS